MSPPGSPSRMILREWSIAAIRFDFPDAFAPYIAENLRSCFVPLWRRWSFLSCGLPR